jgi:cytoskeletal protein RodZ
VADIGSTLREARMRARIDMTEVETRTKIRAKYLRALENEEWDLLPGPVYVKSFLRTYGDYLGLDSRMLVDDYKRRYERLSDHELRPIAALSRDRERAARGPLLPPWAVIGGILLVIVAVLYIVGTANKGGSPAQTVTHHATKPPARPHHRPAATKRVAVATTARVELAATGTVYVCEVTGDGSKPIKGLIYSAGQRIPTVTAPKVLLTLGNASVRLRVNGKSVPVSASSSAIRYLIGPGTPSVRKISLAAAPKCP